jgi:simple sugar transport system ATP-binding protein
VLALADRVAVMYRGRVIAEVSPDTPREEIGLLMAGVTGGGGARAESTAGEAGPRHAAPGAVPVRPVEADSSPRHAAPDNGTAAGPDSEDKA